MARPNEGFLISFDFGYGYIWFILSSSRIKISCSIHFSGNKRMSGFAELVLLGTIKGVTNSE